MHEPMIHTHIRAFAIYVNQNTRTSIRRRLDRKLRKFARSIERVSVRLKDVNGPRGGVDHVCRIKVVLRNLSSIVYEKQDISLVLRLAALWQARSGPCAGLCNAGAANLSGNGRMATVPLTESNKES
jgi:hypothetical protein